MVQPRVALISTIMIGPIGALAVTWSLLLGRAAALSVCQASVKETVIQDLDKAWILPNWLYSLVLWFCWLRM
jgi:hypothetical protein